MNEILNQPILEDTADDKLKINNIENEQNLESVETIDSNKIDENVNQELDSDDTTDEQIDNTTNCLALTVRENYHMVKVKNYIRKGARISWKVALSIFTINFLNMFL